MTADSMVSRRKTLFSHTRQTYPFVCISEIFTPYPSAGTIQLSQDASHFYILVIDMFTTI